IQENLIWIIPVGAVLLIGVVLLVLFLVRKGKKVKPKKPVLASQSEYLAALGGAENILEKKIIGSRIVIKLSDNQKADPKKLLAIGVASYIQMSDKLTLVCKDNAEDVYRVIFS
ncbi:MAG: hypothetical protein J5736_04480, partial [Bacilli bacterium]|nr:hypothetical protein [Bacilli bacterium]